MGDLFDRWLFLFICGIICINYPFVRIFDRDVFIAGIPLIVCYFLVGWLVSIVVIFIFANLFKN